MLSLAAENKIYPWRDDGRSEFQSGSVEWSACSKFSASSTGPVIEFLASHSATGSQSPSRGMNSVGEQREMKRKGRWRHAE
ncbi:hypothetical protein RRG08_018030 [Elysia crispata]|uniref:Uncharacterized protein n=1 Tax=Elysia crispata TaxID=231223 RepID=A0AAE1DDY5_9GAST|nr:hypothetical protein RRG08_018030 [Elysia crispata]